MSNTSNTNDNLILICGESGAGKSASLLPLKNDKGIMYLNCEAGKKLPFKAQFKQFTVTDPYQVYEAFEKAEEMDSIHTIVVDSLTYLIDMFESVHVLTSSNKMSAWSDYAQFFKNLMQQYVAASTKNVIFLAHTLTTLNETEMVMQTSVPIKGSLKNQGVESMFSCVVGVTKKALKDLKGYENGLLVITPEEEAVGYKHVFQTKITKDTVHSRIRHPLGMWETKETYIDNNIKLLLDRLHEYYNEDDTDESEDS